MRTLPSRPILDALRWNLLAALGLPMVALVACGGTAEGESDEHGAGGAGGTVSGDGGATTGGGGSTGGSGGATGGGTGAPFGVCTNPRPFGGEDTGFVLCDEGYLHRPEKKTCPSSVPRAGEQPPLGGEVDECRSDSDCEGQHAHCGTGTYGFGQEHRECLDGCVEDSECAEGQICLCGDPVGRCVSNGGVGGCTEDGDCPGEAQCLGQIFPGTCGGTNYAFACESIDDECRANQDCASGQECTAGRTCVDAAVCGRPFLVELTERRAESRERGDWLLRLAQPELDGLSVDRRGRLAAHWQRIGLMEHASIAAFARFSLQLLSLGAPAELIEETNQALADETRHARLCFGLASHYAGRALGPGALDMGGALESLDAADILRTTILEGCVGETLAALEATEAAGLAQDPRIAQVLSGIADDEARHARLAWRFVQWLVGERPELREVARETFRAVVDEARGRRVSVESGEVDLSTFGVLPRTISSRLRQEALSAVVAPCAEQLLSATVVAERGWPAEADAERAQGRESRSRQPLGVGPRGACAAGGRVYVGRSAEREGGR